MDKVKNEKFVKMELETYLYKKYMCSSCNFFQENHCTKNRIFRICAKKRLKNK